VCGVCARCVACVQQGGGVCKCEAGGYARGGIYTKRHQKAFPLKKIFPIYKYFHDKKNFLHTGLNNMVKTFKELLNEITQSGKLASAATANFKASGSNSAANARNDRKHNVRNIETDTHHEIHFDSDYDEGLVSRVHKNTGKVDHNYHVQVHRAGSLTGTRTSYRKNPNGEFKPSGTKSVTTLKENKDEGSVRARKTGTILLKETRVMSNNRGTDPFHNRRLFNVKKKETDTHHETHFDSDHERGLISRVHKKTGKVEHNYGVEHRPAYRDKFGTKFEASSRFKKNPKGEFKPHDAPRVTTLKENNQPSKNHMKINITAKTGDSDHAAHKPYPSLNVKEKETDTHYETHHDTHRDKGFVTRVHKVTGKVTRNYHTGHDRTLNGGILRSYDVKNRNGEFK